LKEIYAELVDRLTLLPAHAEELKTKRGFTDETIKQNKFCSAGQGVLEIDNALRMKFKEKDLVASGVHIIGEREIRLNPILLQDRIIIPYLDGGKAYHIRFSLPGYRRSEKVPKMLGFSGVGVEFYQKDFLGSNYDLVITEGEFKATACNQLGIPCISIPGIASFSDKHFPKLVDDLKASGKKKLYILFDNEVKDDPQFKSYKENPQDRYWTQFYACHMADKLERSGFEVLVAWLPDAWRENGKIDIDGALAQGRTALDLIKVLQDAKPRLDFIASLPDEAGRVVHKKVSQRMYKSAIRREQNRYIATRAKGKGTQDEIISNFVVNVVATHDTQEGIKRELEFTNEQGRKSRPFTIEPDQMSSPDSFKTFCLSLGDYIWRGNPEDLSTLWESEFLMQDEGRVIFESDHVGWVDKEKTWVFQNIAIREDMTELRPDGSGVYWFEKKGIKPVPLSMEGRNATMEGVPYLHTNHTIDIFDVKNRFADTIGEDQAAVLMGWVNSVVFMEEIFAICNSFPFLFVTGQFQSGKSTIAEWVMHFFGIENSGKAISQTTPVAIQRLLSYHSSLPVFLDEYRNTKEVTYKNGFLRNAYNRQSSGKGTKGSSYTVRDAKVRGTLVIAGEETPKDGAVWSRCVTVYVSRHARRVNHHKWFVSHKGRFSAHFLSMIRTKPKMLESFMEIFEYRRAEFEKLEIEERLAFNYAGVAAGYEIVFGRDYDFMPNLIRITQEMQSEFKEERAISVFFDDLLAMKTRGLIDEKYWKVEEGRIYLYFHGLHNIWSQEFRKGRGEEAFKEASIRAYLKEEPGFLEAGANTRIMGDMHKCVVFDYNRAPDAIKYLSDLRELSPSKGTYVS
jgi:DNA primase